MRTGALAVPETFSETCPFCSRRTLEGDQRRCPFCKSELDCSGFGDCRSREWHAMTCHEVACDLRYLPLTCDWYRVVTAFERRSESLDGNERASDAWRRQHETVSSLTPSRSKK